MNRIFNMFVYNSFMLEEYMYKYGYTHTYKYKYLRPIFFFSFVEIVIDYQNTQKKHCEYSNEWNASLKVYTFLTGM